MEGRTKRIRRSKEQIIQDKIQILEDKISDYRNKIAEAEKEIEQLKTPSAPPIKMKDIKNKADELGVSLDDIMAAVEKLGKKK